MKVNKINKIFQKGQSLIEVIFALVVITIILTSLSKTIIHALKNVEYSCNQNYSLHLAQTKMEEIRQYRDSHSWQDFWLEYLKDQTENEYEREHYNATGEQNDEGIFERVVTCFDRGGTKMDKMEVIVSVSWWSDSSTQHTIPVSGYFTKWN